MEKNKFKVGDLIVGNHKADRYNWTCVGWKGIVIQIVDYERIKVENPRDAYKYTVYSECFDLVAATQLNEPSEPSYDIY